MGTFHQLEELHRRISNFETNNMDREIQQMEDAVREISERERNATSELLAERAKSDSCTQQNKDLASENQRIRKELAAAKKLLADLKEEQMSAKLRAQDLAVQEELELKKKVGELNHRLITRTHENARLTDELKKAKDEIEVYRNRCIQMENGRIPTHEFQVMGSLQQSLETQNALTKQLTAELESSRAKIAGLEAKNAALEEALKSTKEDLEQSQQSFKALSRELEEQGHTTDEVNKMLNQKIQEAVCQKADLRVKYLRLQADHVSIERDLNDMKKKDSEAVKRCEELQKDLEIERNVLRKKLRDEVEALKQSEKELKEKLELEEAKSKGDQAKVDAMKQQQEKLKDFVKQQDKQCDELANQVQFLSDELEAYKEKFNKKSVEAAEMRQKLTSSGVQEAEMERVKEELGRAKDKIKFMEREIKTLHVDYRGELADLTKKLALAQKDTFYQAKTVKPVEEKRFSFVENQIQQLQKELAAEKRLLNEKTVELENARKENVNSSMEEDLKKKTIDAAKALNDAINKLQAKNNEIAEKDSKIGELTNELERTLNQVADLEDEYYICKQKVNKLESCVLYWKDLYEGRNQQLGSDTMSNYTDEMDKENEAVYPITKDNVEDEDEGNSTLKYGMMRHEIAHRFKKVWMAVAKKSYECAKCHQHLPTVSTAMKCKDCNLYAHLSCARRMGKTCGLPTDYARLYVDAVSEHRQFEEQQLRLRQEEQMEM